MEKMNCDIIKDLIPSYVDGICSGATKKYVEEHLKNCDKCRQMVSLCKNNVLSEEKLERQSLDGLKKIKKTLKLQNLACYLSLALTVFLGIQVFAATRLLYTISFHSTFLYVICILACLLTCLGYKGRKNLEKRDWIFGAASLAVSLYSALLVFYAVNELLNDAETLFGREPVECGEFLRLQFGIAFVLQLGFLLRNSICILRQDKACNWLLCLNMVGLFLPMEYDSFLYYMDNKETVMQAITLPTCRIVGIGALGIAASVLLTAIYKPKRNKSEETLSV